MSEEKHKSERIAKRMARAGLCSRREAERWIEQGRVKVNGDMLETPAFTVSAADHIEVDGQVLQEAEEARLFLYHKPVGLVTTHKDPQGRPTVFENLPKHLPRVVSVGRLDLASEGLLLLTNDGELAQYLAHPSTGWKRKYRVRVFGKVDEARLKALKSGITVKDVHYKSIDAAVEGKQEGANTWISVTLREGKNREIRRVMEALGLKVNRLIRVSYGPFNLDSMPSEAVKEIKPQVLQDQLAGYFKGRS